MTERREGKESGVIPLTLHQFFKVGKDHLRFKKKLGKFETPVRKWSTHSFRSSWPPCRNLWGNLVLRIVVKGKSMRYPFFQVWILLKFLSIVFLKQNNKFSPIILAQNPVIGAKYPPEQDL